MAANLIAIGDTEANSDEITVIAGTPVTISLKGAANGARVLIKQKSDLGAYEPSGFDLTTRSPSKVLAGPGIYRLTRVAGSLCGVFRD